MADQSNIAAGTVIVGRIEAEGDLEVHGQVEGTISVGGELSVGPDALLKCDLSGRRIMVAGAVAGEVRAEQAIVLESGSRVQGDVRAPSLAIRPGARLRGHVQTADGGVARAAKTAAPAERKAQAPATQQTSARTPIGTAASRRGSTRKQASKRAPEPVMPRAASRAKKRAPAKKAKAAAPKPVVPALKKRTKKAKRRSAR